MDHGKLGGRVKGREGEKRSEGGAETAARGDKKNAQGFNFT